MPPKPIKRIDVKGTPPQVLSPHSHRVKTEWEVKKKREDDWAEAYASLTQEEKDAIEKARIKRMKLNKEKADKKLKQFNRDSKRRFLKWSIDSKGKYNYAERVRIVKLVKGRCNHGDKAPTEAIGLRGRIRYKNGCRCGHSKPGPCYEVSITSLGEQFHFEECELERANG